MKVGIIIFTSLDPPMNLQPGSEQGSARLHFFRIFENENLDIFAGNSH